MNNAEADDWEMTMEVVGSRVVMLRMVISENYAYVADGGDGFDIISIEDPQVLLLGRRRN